MRADRICGSFSRGCAGSHDDNVIAWVAAEARNVDRAFDLVDLYLPKNDFASPRTAVSVSPLVFDLRRTGLANAWFAARIAARNGTNLSVSPLFAGWD